MGCPVQDFIREKDLTLRSYGLKEFTALMFKRVPGLEHFAPMVGNIFAQFNAYKQVLGAQLAERSLPSCSCLPQRLLSSSWMLFALASGRLRAPSHRRTGVWYILKPACYTLSTGQLEPALDCGCRHADRLPT